MGFTHRYVVQQYFGDGGTGPLGRQDEALAAAPARRYDYAVRPTDLPGGDLIVAGLDDARRGLESIPALLVAIGAPRLRRLGYAVSQPPPDPELRLYTLLARADAASAHGRYNALVRRLVSFERAAECVR
ncbi:MAG: hypothetical protein ACREON_10895 [Gemmatimonadaceae bacterium]